MYGLDKNVNLKIIFEINEIDIQLDMYKNLLEDTIHKSPDIIEITAIASVLHSFYNGVEKIFEIITKKLDKFIIKSGRTHQELLNNVCIASDSRPAVINNDTYLILIDYLKFRHFFRHSYSFHLQWDKMDSLAINLFDTWKSVKEQLLEFIKFLENTKTN